MSKIPSRSARPRGLVESVGIAISSLIHTVRDAAGPAVTAPALLPADSVHPANPRAAAMPACDSLVKSDAHRRVERRRKETDA